MGSASLHSCHRVQRCRFASHSLAVSRLVFLFAALAAPARAETVAEWLCPSDPYVRAGHPQDVHRFAKPTITREYCVGYVGGGSAFDGQPRTLEEGVWGMDYCGHWLPHRVWLNWYHGRFAQGGSGRYATDGPHLIKK